MLLSFVNLELKQPPNLVTTNETAALLCGQCDLLLFIHSLLGYNPYIGHRDVFVTDVVTKC